MLFSGLHRSKRGWSAVSDSSIGLPAVGARQSVVTLKYDFEFIWAAWVIRSVAKYKAPRTMPMFFFQIFLIRFAFLGKGHESI